MQPTAAIRIALLICDPIAEIIRQAHGDYHVLYSSLLTRSLPPGIGKEAFTLDAYDVCEKMEYPPEDAEGYNALLISGSRWSAYDDLEWINKLVGFVKDVAERKPKIKIIGICFGHQIVGRALGGSCIPTGKWELGPSQLVLSEVGKKIFGKEKEFLNIHQCHRDVVPTVPTYPYHFHCIASTDVCVNHGMVLFEDPILPLASTEMNVVKAALYPNGANYGMHIDESPSLISNGISTPTYANDMTRGSVDTPVATNGNGIMNGIHLRTNGSTDAHTNGTHANSVYDYQGHPNNDSDTRHTLRSIRILTVQGHPEFHAGIISAIVDMRSKSGVLSPEFAEETRRHNALELPIPGLPVYNNNEGTKEGWLNEGTSFGAVILTVLGL